MARPPTIPIFSQCYRSPQRLIRALPQTTNRPLSTSRTRDAKPRAVDPEEEGKAFVHHVDYRASTEFQQPRRAESLIHGIRGSVNRVPIFASTASETKHNVISEQFARQCGLEIHSSSASFVLGNGGKVKPTGTAKAVWQFDGEVMDKGVVDFVVLPDCSRPVIFGHDFLDRTGTMTSNWHRLKVEAVPAEDFSCVHILGEPPQCIAGRIRKVPVHALPATGCEINLISERYLLLRDLGDKVNKDIKDWIKLTDGRLVQTTGVICMSWAFGSEKWLNIWPGLYFSVLPDCPYDVVLGQELLYDSNAFLRYSDCFRETIPNSCHLLQAGIAVTPSIILGFRRKPGISDALRATGDSSILEELNRRAAADHEISKKDVSDRPALWKAEQERRSNWNAGVKSCDREDEGDCGLTGSSRANPSATDVASQSLASSTKEHSLLAGDYTSLKIDSSFTSDGGSSIDSDYDSGD